MAQLLKKILISTSVAAGMGLAISAPASAASITGASIDGGSSDYILYCLDGAQTSNCTGSGTLDQVLGSDAGNIELDANSEASGGWGAPVSFTGQLNGKDITISSLSQADWTDDLGTQWVGDALAAIVNQNPGLAPFAGAIGGLTNSIWTALKLDPSNPLAIFSDPNVSYVTQDGDASGEISVGLIGHFNAFENPLYKNVFTGGLAEALGQSPAVISGLVQNLQASELVKIVYNGETQYKYSFSATNTGVTEASDNFSHSGEYVVKIDGMEMEPPASTPEPSAMLGLAGLVGLYAGKRKMQKDA
ncbi:MAG: NF038130 family PEP-CTERM protein [Cyanobacteria bacterium P01_D01_bin.73]